MGPSFTVAAGPRQRSHSQARVPWDSWPHFTVSDSRLPKPRGSGHIDIPQEQGSPVIPPGTWFPFRRRATVEVFDPASPLESPVMAVSSRPLIVVLFYVMCVICDLCLFVVPLPPDKNPFAVKINNNNITWHWPHIKCLLLYFEFCRCWGNVSSELFPSNGCCTVACLHSCYLAMGLHATIYSFWRSEIMVLNFHAI
jgi:hypothetical protein